MLQTVLFCIKILFQCVGNVPQSQYLCHKSSEACLLLLQSPSITLRLITRALLLYIAPEKGDCRQYVLRNDEINMLIDILGRNESLLPTDLSLQMVLKMMDYLTNCAENASLLLQWGAGNILSSLADKLADDSTQQKVLTELIWKLMQLESGCNCTAITTSLGSDLKFSSGKYNYRNVIQTLSRRLYICNQLSN